MGRGNPKVISGRRGAREDDEPKRNPDPVMAAIEDAAADRKKAKMAKKVDPNDPYSIVFQSRFPGYIIQLTAPMPKIDPHTGIRTEVRPIKAKFENGIYKIPRRHDLEEAQFIITRLEAHPNFGRGGPGAGKNFWRQDEALVAGKKKRIKDLIAAVKADPELAEEAGLTFADTGDDDTENVGDRGPEDRKRKKKDREEEDEARPKKKKKAPPNSAAPKKGESLQSAPREFEEEGDEEDADTDETDSEEDDE